MTLSILILLILFCPMIYMNPRFKNDSCKPCSCDEYNLVNEVMYGNSWALVEDEKGMANCFCCSNSLDAKLRSGVNLNKQRGRFFGDMHHVCESLSINEAHCHTREARDCNYQTVYFKDDYSGCFVCRPRCSSEQECQDLGRVCGLINSIQPVRSCTGSGSGYIPGRDNPREYSYAVRTNYANFFHYLTPAFQIYGVSLKADKNYKPSDKNENELLKPFDINEKMRKPSQNAETLFVVKNNHKRVSFKSQSKDKESGSIITFSKDSANETANEILTPSTMLPSEIKA